MDTNMLSFTKEELECLYNAIKLQLKNISMSQVNYDRRKEMLNKINYMIDNIARQEKTTAKFCEWQKQLTEQNND
jgi:hypothetical protein